MKCSLPNCKGKYYAVGLCNSHYSSRWARKHPEVRVLSSARTRCFNTASPQYADYGGRGITMCDRWRFGESGKSALQCFLEDMGHRPSADYSLDRIDNDGNYDPGNCRWATLQQQNNNVRQSKVGKSGFLGVQWVTKNKKWRAVMRVNGKKRHLGLFDSPQDAAACYQKAKSEYVKSLNSGAYYNAPPILLFLWMLKTGVT